MSRDKKLIQLPSGALEQLQNERMQKIQSFMDELGKQSSIEHQAFDLVMGKVLEMGDLHMSPEGQAGLVRKVGALAQEIARYKLQRLNEGVKQIMRENNIHDAPEHIVWSARRVGVELLEQPASTEPEAH